MRTPVRITAILTLLFLVTMATGCGRGGGMQAARRAPAGGGGGGMPGAAGSASSGGGGPAAPTGSGAMPGAANTGLGSPGAPRSADAPVQGDVATNFAQSGTTEGGAPPAAGF